MVNIFSSMSYFVTLCPHSFNWEMILNNAKLYSLIVLKSCNLRYASSHIELLGGSQFSGGHISLSTSIE